MFDEITHQCTCGKCGYSWRARGETKPAVCASCTSRGWDSKTKKFNVIIAKMLAGEEGQHKFGIIPYVDKPSVEATDIFFITPDDYPKYFYGLLARTRCKINSAIILIGDFELGEDLILKINECKLIYAHSQGIGREYVDDACIYNIKSYYEALKAQKAREEEAHRLAALEEERKQRLLEEAKKKIEADVEAEKRREAAREKIADESIPLEERLQAAAYLEYGV